MVTCTVETPEQTVLKTWDFFFIISKHVNICIDVPIVTVKLLLFYNQFYQ